MASSMNLEARDIKLRGEEKPQSGMKKNVRKNAITFENGNPAVVITTRPDASAKAILDALEIAPPGAVILIFGGTVGLDDSRKGHLASLLADGVTPVAAELGALIIDGGI